MLLNLLSVLVFGWQKFTQQVNLNIGTYNSSVWLYFLSIRAGVFQEKLLFYG